jgi:hypothetical protein
MVDWIEQFSERIASHVRPADPRMPIGCHYCWADDVWELTLFVSRTEIFGGEFDGRSVPGLFVLDLIGLLLEFDEVCACWWQPFPIDGEDDIGAHISIEGRHGEHRLWVRIPAVQPQPLTAGCVANVLGGTIERQW